MARLRQGDAHQAEQFLRLAFNHDRIRPDKSEQFTARTLTNLATVLVALKKSDEAKDAVTKALEIFTKFPDLERTGGKKPGTKAEAQALQSTLNGDESKGR